MSAQRELPSSLQPGETHEEFAARLLEKHGPPPQRVVDMVHDLQRQAAARTPSREAVSS